MYDYKWFVHLLLARLPIMNELMQELMLPTYSYARIYAKDDELKKHKDRPACEVSVTLHLGSDGSKWPIWFTKPNGETVSYDLEPGQAVVYLGMVSEHWRDKFEGNEYAQVFLHYVRFGGEHWDVYFDKKKKN
jgi:alkylated DNA repair dioxygenase AlkB